MLAFGANKHLQIKALFAAKERVREREEDKLTIILLYPQQLL